MHTDVLRSATKPAQLLDPFGRSGREVRQCAFADLAAVVGVLAPPEVGGECRLGITSTCMDPTE